MATNHITRRHFLKQSALGAGSLVAGGLLLSQTGACAEAAPARLGVALVGLGNYSQGQLGPALRQTQHCYLAGIVTGTPAKAESWTREYQLDPAHVYSYDTFDRIIDDPTIRIVYVVLPNSLHAEYVIRAAQAGKHVICEKPMAVSVAECEAMISACQAAGVRLGVGYRLYHEPHNQEMIRLGREQVHGPVRWVESAMAFQAVNWYNWRFEKNLAGGGPLMDVGIYSIQGARMVLGEEPLYVTAQTPPKHYPKVFATIEESLMWQMTYPSGAIASCSTSYAYSVNRLYAAAENGTFELGPAFSYTGISGKNNGTEMKFPQVVQQALHMDAFSLHVQGLGPNITPGEMGLQDMKIIRAIYEAMEMGRQVAI